MLRIPAKMYPCQEKYIYALQYQASCLPYVTMLENKITQTKKDLVDDTHNLKELLFNKNGTFKLVKSLELVEKN